MSSWQTLARVQYLATSTPADDRVGRSTGNAPVDRLRHHVTGAIDRGEKTAIVERPARRYVQCAECESSFQAETLPVHTFRGVRCPGSPEPPILAEPDFDMPARVPEPPGGTGTASTDLQTAPVGKRFILAGHAIVTLVGKDSRYTFKVTRKDPEVGSRYTEPVYFVALLTGPDNTADYTYVGILDTSTGLMRLTKKSTYLPSSAPVRAWDWTIARVFADRPIAPAQVIHAGRCGRCGRLLTVPSSVASGFGPECSGKVGA